MARSLIYKPLGLFAEAFHAGISWGAIWGALAGCVIGTGISLSIGLPYSGASNMICAVILVSGIMGALFGHVMARLVDNNDDPLGRIIGNANHHISGKILKNIDLEEHQTLKAEIRAKRISGTEAMEIIHSVRMI